MRLWLSRNSPVPLREQLATQIMLGVISEDFKPGQRVPSIREVARRYRIHSNTVSAAYNDLVQRGWLERRRGSGMYVPKREAPSITDTSTQLDQLVSSFLEAALAQGFNAGEVRSRLEDWLNRPAPDRLVVMEPERELAEILAAEILDGAGIAAASMPFQKPVQQQFSGCAVAALSSRAKQLREFLPPAIPVILLRLHSVASSLHGQRQTGRLGHRGFAFRGNPALVAHHFAGGCAGSGRARIPRCAGTRLAGRAALERVPGDRRDYGAQNPARLPDPHISRDSGFIDRGTAALPRTCRALRSALASAAFDRMQSYSWEVRTRCWRVDDCSGPGRSGLFLSCARGCGD
jgi:DNA-binding transcriptional regulator YhcF (GntR family)